MGELSRNQQEKQWKNPSLPRPTAFKQSLKKMPLSNPDYGRGPTGLDQCKGILQSRLQEWLLADKIRS